jgi:hypothetical protein
MDARDAAMHPTGVSSWLGYVRADLGQDGRRSDLFDPWQRLHQA